MFGGLNPEVAKQAAVLHSGSLNTGDIGVQIVTQALERRERFVLEGLGDDLAGFRQIGLEDFQAEGFLGRKVICKRALRNSRRLHDVPNAGSDKTPLVHDSQASFQQFFPVRDFRWFNRCGAAFFQDCFATPGLTNFLSITI